jgi:chromosome segregation ATPase
MSEVKSAMEYVFGNGIVCDCLDTARAVAYHPSVNKKVFMHTILAL